MSGVYVIPTKFTAIDGMSSTVRSMGANLNRMVESANVGLARQERLFRRLTPHLGHATKQLLSYASAAAVLAGIGYSGKAIIDYETAIQSLQAVTGVSDEQLKGFKAEIVDTANKTQKSATDIAGSFEVIGSMMSQYLTDPKALRMISDAGITLAKASRQELVPTLENLTSIMNQFNLKAEQSTDVINRLTAGEIVGSLRTSQVAESLQHFGANAATANVSLAESVALVEALAKQRPAENLGIDARNLLIVMDSAKALDKKAKHSLKKSGVDMDFLMNKTHSLSERLHELSKIQGNAVGMVRVFGERNVTAAKVIFNQLGTYDDYVAKIRTTNEAQHQAAINSNTLAQTVDRLKNTWLNYITTNNEATVGLTKVKDAVKYVTDNLDEIVSVGVNVIKVFALWKGAMIAQKAVLIGYDVAVAASKALSAAYFLGDMVKYVAITQGMTKASAALAIAQESVTAAIAANPIGLAIIAATALGAGIWYLSKRERELNEEIERQHSLNIAEHIRRQSEETAKLAQHWKDVGYSIKDATIKALQFQVATATENLGKAGRRKHEAEKAQTEAYDNALFPAFSSDVNRANTEVERANEEFRLAQADKLGTTQAVISGAQGMGLSADITNRIAKGLPLANAPVLSGGAATQTATNQFSNNSTVQEMNKKIGGSKVDMDYDKLKAAFSDALKDQKPPTVNLLQSASGPGGTNISTPNSY